MSLPGALAPPKGINPHAIDHWFVACKNLPEDVRLARAQALRTFMQRCDSAGLSPFEDPADPNIAIRNFLGTRRRLYVRYADLTKFLKPLFVRKVTREAYLTEYGFAIRIEGWVRTVADPLWFRHIKAAPGWRFSLTWIRNIAIRSSWTLVSLSTCATLFIAVLLPGMWVMKSTAR